MQCLFCLETVFKEGFDYLTSPPKCTQNYSIFDLFSKYVHVQFDENDLLDTTPICLSCQDDIKNVESLADKVDSMIQEITKTFATVCIKVIESEKKLEKTSTSVEENFQSIRKSIIKSFEPKLVLPDCTYIQYEQPQQQKRTKKRKVIPKVKFNSVDWSNNEDDPTLEVSPICSPMRADDDDPDFELDDVNNSDPDFESSSKTTVKKNADSMNKLKKKLKRKHAQNKAVRSRRTRKRDTFEKSQRPRVVQDLGDGKFQYLGYEFIKVDEGYQCGSCDFTTKSSIRQNMLSHIKGNHRDAGKFVCQFKDCEKGFGSSKHLRRHEETHNDTHSHMCELCGKFCKTKKSLMDHKGRHEGRLVQECRLCHKKISNKTGLQIHMKTVHQGLKEFQCHLCALKVSTSQSLKRHMLTHAPKKEKPLSYDVPNKPFACELCESRFPIQSNLRYHMKTVHAQEKKFECDVCHRKFAILKLLRRHAFSHSDDCNEICPTCGKTFKTAVYLRNHLRRHEVVEKSFKCEICHVKLTTKASLVFHISTVHEKQRNFACDLCPKLFFTSNSLKRHGITHTNERPYACDRCGGRYQQPCTLKRHIQEVHEKIPPKNPRKTPMQRRLLKEAKRKQELAFKLGLTNQQEGDDSTDNKVTIHLQSRSQNNNNVTESQDGNSWHTPTEENILGDSFVSVTHMKSVDPWNEASSVPAITVIHTPVSTPLQFSTTGQRYVIASSATSSTDFTEFPDPNYFSQEIRDCRNYLRDST